MNATTHKAITDVTRRKGRSILVILGIIVGVLGLTAVNVASDTITRAFAYSNDQSKTPDIQFAVQAVDPSFTTTLTTVPNVDKIQVGTIYQSRWQISSGSGHVRMQISAYPKLQHMLLSPFQLSSGRYPGKGEIVMESSDNTIQHVAINDMVTITTQNGPTNLRVVGLARTLGLPSAGFISTAIAYMSVDGLQQTTHISAANSIQISIHNTKQVNQTARLLADILHSHHYTILNTTIGNSYQLTDAVNGIFSIMQLVAIIAILLTCFLIINTISTLIAEQTKIIGTMKAIGGTRRKIINGYLLSVTLYGAVGSILGIGLGIACGYVLATYLAQVVTLDLGTFQVSPITVLISLAVGLVAPWLAAIVPLWTGTSITVRQAMASYGVSGGQKKRGHTGRQLIWIPQTLQMGMRNIFRKRSRAVLTLLALTLSGAMFMAVQATTSSIDNTMHDVFSIYDEDISLNTNPTSYTQLRTIITNEPDVRRVERSDSRTIKTIWGTVLLTGLETDTQLYHHQIMSGRWFNANEANTLVISDTVANKTHLKVGNTLKFSSATNEATWKIIGVTHDLDGGTGILGTVITSINSFNTFYGLPADLTSSLMIQARDHSHKAVDHLANQLDERLAHAGLTPSIVTQQQNIERNQGQFQVIYILFYAVAAIVALVGILGLFNTLSASVLERRREIGILRSMGATGWQVASVFWVEGIILALLAWAVGIVLGVPGAYGFVSMLSAVLLQLNFAFNPLTFVTMLIVILLIATLASIGPAMSASRVRIADTLRYE